MYMYRKLTLKPKVLLVNWKWHHTSLGLEMILDNIQYGISKVVPTVHMIST